MRRIFLCLFTLVLAAPISLVSQSYPQTPLGSDDSTLLPQNNQDQSARCPDGTQPQQAPNGSSVCGLNSGDQPGSIDESSVPVRKPVMASNAAENGDLTNQYSTRNKAQNLSLPPEPLSEFQKFAPLSALLPIVAVFVESITIVPAGYIGVQQTLGSVNMATLGEGLHFVNPISHVSDVDVRVVKAQLEKANAGTKDLQVVHTDIVVNYRIDGTKAAHIYKEFGLDLQDKILIPAINESFKAVTAHYNSEELITKRDEVSTAIQSELQQKVLPYGLSISTISVKIDLKKPLVVSAL